MILLFCFRCPAQLDFKIKLATSHTRRNDRLVYDYPSVLVLSNAHNHSLQCAQSLQQLRLTEKTRQSLFRLFDSGLSAGQVYRLLQTDMVCEDISNMANNNITPKLNSIYYNWHLWKKETFGNYSGDELFQAKSGCNYFCETSWK